MKRSSPNVESAAVALRPMSLGGVLEAMRGSKRAKTPAAIKRRDLTSILRSVTTLIENGVPLPKALNTVAREKMVQKYAPILDAIRRKVETGESFSGALAAFPDTFNELMVNQIRVAERSGTLVETLLQVTAQQEKMNDLRSLIVKKLAYPVLLLVMGSVVVTFMLLFVVPIFEKTYADAKIPLPLVTQLLIGAGSFATSYYWIFLLIGVTSIVAIKQLRARPASAYAMDRWLLRAPLLGGWLRDLAVLQLMDVLGTLMESGFKLAEALKVCAGSVGNRALKESVASLESAVRRGERFSRELERHGEMFPPVVSQLVIIGEQTGNLAKATSHIRDHLRRQIERNTTVMVGTIEPILTISLAAAIGFILLAIYLPMFDMIGAVAK